jgi:hypothetical protein
LQSARLVLENKEETDMKITMPETRTVLFKDLEEGDFFIYNKELFCKIESVYRVDDVVEKIMNERDATDSPVFNAMLLDEYDGESFDSFAKDAEVIPVDVEIKVSYK